jgi:putative transposase
VITTFETEKCSTPATVIQAYVFALDPTPELVSRLRSHIGGTRFAYNALLGLVTANWYENRTRKEAGEEVTKDDYLDVHHLDLQNLWYERRDEIEPWWSENGSSTYNYARLNLSKAFANFRTDRAKFPTFKKRGSSRSVSFMSGAVRLTDSHRVRVSRIGEIKTYESTRKLYRHLDRGTGRILAATITERGGKFSISFNVQVTRALLITRPPERVIGIDVGVATLYTGASPAGDVEIEVQNPRHFVKAEKKLAYAQRIASRRRGPGPGVAPSQRWKRANARVQQIHTDVRNARRNLIHETATMLAKTYDVIVIEDLNVKGMVKNHSLAKHISDAAWGEFSRQLEYKTKWYGSALVKAARFYPSSKTCSQCGAVKDKLLLDERTFHCEARGLTLDRGVNAAINLARWGLPGTHSGTGRGGEVRPEQQKLVATAHPDEASTETLPAVSA